MNEGEWMRLHLNGPTRALARVSPRKHITVILLRDLVLSMDPRPRAAADPVLSLFPL